MIAVPSCVWRINLDTPEEGKTISMDDADDRWWEQIDLNKLILASNGISQLSDDIRLLPALTVLDVSSYLIIESYCPYCIIAAHYKHCLVVHLFVMLCL